MVMTAKDKARRERIDVLKELQEWYEKRILRGDDLTQTEIAEYMQIGPELEKLERIERCRWDMMEFAKEYLSEERGSNPDHFLLKKETPSPPFHYEMAAKIREVKDRPGAAKLAIIAPREHAKSAIVSQVNILHSICYELTKYTIFISATRPTVVKLMKFIKDVLKYNDKLRDDFGELMSPNVYRNIMDREDAITTFNNITIECYGADSPLRGARSGVTRPDLIFDDLEDPSNVTSREAIQKLVDKFDKEFMPLGDTRHSKYFYAGTILAYDSLLHQIYTKRQHEWETMFWQAVIRDADRQDLWQEYETIVKDYANPNRGQESREFFERNKEEMLRGAVVLWPEKRDYKQLMDLKITNPLAFQTEQQNDPIDKSSQLFSRDRMTFYENFDGEFIYDHGHQIPLSECVQDVAGIDLARGKSKGDYIVIGRVVKSKAGAMYVIHCEPFKAKVSEQLKRTADFIEQYRPKVFIVEGVAYQGSFYDQLLEELQRRGVYNTKVVEVPPKKTKSKEDRIAELEPMVTNGSLRFNPSHYLLIDQLEKFKPTGSTVNDDCPDIIQQCVAYMNENQNTGVLEYYRELQKREQQQKF
jgi:predicted phage terminase large subunit-like protein